tara:strand:+ start:2940 stop:3371 length:432 start_codon:yes stop_codon:yes gene_type:complete
MTKLWDDLKDNMREWSSSAVEKAEEMSRVALNKTEELTRISKIKYDILQLHRQINKSYENIGRLVYSKTKNDHNASFSGDSEFFQIINDIDRLKKNIIDKDDQINSIKIEFDIEHENQSNKKNEKVETDDFSKNKSDKVESSI